MDDRIKRHHGDNVEQGRYFAVLDCVVDTYGNVVHVHRLLDFLLHVEVPLIVDRPIRLGFAESAKQKTLASVQLKVEVGRHDTKRADDVFARDGRIAGIQPRPKAMTVFECLLQRDVARNGNQDRRLLWPCLRIGCRGDGRCFLERPVRSGLVFGIHL